MPVHSPLLIPEGFPPLTTETSARVEEIVTLLRQSITRAGGSISFADYMEMALYAPGLGYYTGGLQKFGERGDFITAPEISPLFGRCMAKQIAEILSTLENGEILEVGAGTGVLAVELLATLDELQILPHRYLILELSSELRIRQEETLAARLPHWLDRVEWRTDLPEAGWEGVVIGNEFLDALPVHRFALTEQGIMEQRVGWGKVGFEWRLMPAEGHLASALKAWYDNYGEELEIGYVSELALAASAWLASLAERLARGCILLVDYGYPAREYYRSDRYQGTLSCYYRHHRHDDPFILPGMQDITSHVNFTTLAEASVTAGFTVAGYTTQAHFLIATGIAEIFARLSSNDTQSQLSLANQIRRLTLPYEMGEIFKVFAITKGLEQDLIGFMDCNLRAYL